MSPEGEARVVELLENLCALLDARSPAAAAADFDAEAAARLLGVIYAGMAGRVWTARELVEAALGDADGQLRAALGELGVDARAPTAARRLGQLLPRLVGALHDEFVLRAAEGASSAGKLFVVQRWRRVA
ncbi:MAG TPA: hypothetical protein VFB54_09715 [Burkholderiales bacterium]|nr:hypothetical protein [Burkholderiales bacterium]